MPPPALDYFTGAAETLEMISARAAAASLNGPAIATKDFLDSIRLELSAALATGGLADEAKELLPAQTASTTQTGDALATAGYSGNLRFLVSAGLATAGTSPTLIITIETSANGTTGWAAIGSPFATVTDATGAGPQEQLIAVSESLGYVRAVATIGGTSTPTFTFSVMLIGAIAAGSTPSLIITVETSADGSTNWTALPGAAFAEVTDAAGAGVQTMAIAAAKSLGYVRAVAAITTSAGQAFNLALLATALKRAN